MARDIDRYARDQRYEVILDNGEDASKWSSLSDNTSTIVSGTAHITGTQSVSFDKVSGSWSDAYIVRPIHQMGGSDLDAFSSEGQILSSVYIPSLTDVSSYNVALLMASGTDHGAFYTIADTDLSVGWNNLKMDCNSYTTVSGHGVNWKEVKWLGVGVSFDAAANSLSDILLDSVKLQVPTSTYEFSPNIDNITVVAGTEVAIKNGDAADELSVDAADTARTSSTNVIPVQPIDSSGNIISGAAGTSGGLTLYSSPVHFTSVYQAATALDLSGMPFTISNFTQFIDIEAWDASAGFIEKYTPKTHVFSWDSTNDRVTVTDASFVTGGVYKVSILAEDRTISLPLDATKSVILNPINENYSYSALVEDTNITDGTVYYYLDMATYKYAGFQLNLDCDAGTVTATLEGGIRNDGTASASCLYQDIMTTMGFSSVVATAAPAEGMWLANTPMPFKYLRVKVVYATTANTGDATILARVIY